MVTRALDRYGRRLTGGGRCAPFPGPGIMDLMIDGRLGEDDWGQLQGLAAAFRRVKPSQRASKVRYRRFSNERVMSLVSRYSGIKLTRTMVRQ